MNVVTNNFSSKDLVMLLHGSTKGINSLLIQTVYKHLKDKQKAVSALEFSFLEKGISPDPDQVVESVELEEYLRAKDVGRLTIVGHLNGGFVALVAATRGLKIDCLVLLGLSYVSKEGTKQAIAQIIKGILAKGGVVTVIQPEKDEYSSPEEVKQFISEFGLDVKLETVPGNHYFAGFEDRLGEVLSKLV